MTVRKKHRYIKRLCVSLIILIVMLGIMGAIAVKGATVIREIDNIWAMVAVGITTMQALGVTGLVTTWLMDDLNL